jgi:hypothetical protein
LSATAGHRTVTLTWTYPSDLDLNVCEIRRAIGVVPANYADGAQAFRLSSPPSSQPDSSSNTGLDNGVPYCFAIFCQDTSGNWRSGTSLDANAVCATPTAGVPLNPSDVSASDGESQRVTISFTMPPEPVTHCAVLLGPGAAVPSGYPTRHDDPSSQLIGEVSTPGEFVSDVIDPGLINGTDYYYSVFCRNAERWNDSQTDGNSDIGTPSDPLPHNPTDMAASDAEDSLSLITFTMPAPPVSECRLMRKQDEWPSGPFDGDNLGTFTGANQPRQTLDVGLVNGGTYNYAVFCLNGLVWNTGLDTLGPDKNADVATPTDVLLDRVESKAAGASSAGTTLNGPVMQAGAYLLYVVAVAMQPPVEVSTVTGGRLPSGDDLSWVRVASACGGNNDMGISVWRAFGTTVDPFQPVVTLLSSADALVASVVSYRGVNPVVPIVATATGASSNCSFSSPSSGWAVTLTHVSSSVLLGAVSYRDDGTDFHVPAADNIELVETHARTGANAIAIAVVVTSTTTAGGTFGASATRDWAAAGVQIRN